LPTLDQLIEELPHMIIDRSIWFYENFKGIVVNSLFSVYDGVLNDAVQRLYQAWSTVLSHSPQYHDLRSGHAHVFTNPFDMPLPPQREAIWKEIDVARREMRSAVDAILDRLRSAYIEVSIHKTNAKAWKDYQVFRQEVGELDRPKVAKKNLAKKKPVKKRAVTKKRPSPK
ncbi:MAG: hypothetical protein IJ127_08975, partial [Afipia sp.]|nr:hypothetical protein [Afipia sp.]